MAGFWAGLRQRRNEMRTARGKPLLREKHTAKPDHDRNAPPAQAWDEAPDVGNQDAELQTTSHALRSRS